MPTITSIATPEVSIPDGSSNLRRIGTGLAMVLFPLLFVFAFAVHPGLLDPHLLGPRELVLRARHADLLQFAHVLVMLNTGLLVVVALEFKRVLERSGGGRVGLVGAGLAILGALMLAADKGALCLTMSAVDTISDSDLAAAMPALLAMFGKAGWMVLLWGIVLLPIGFAILAIALVRRRAIPRWQGIVFLLGDLLVGTPDGLEIINLGASVLMAIALVPYGMRLISRGPSGDGGIPR